MSTSSPPPPDPDDRSMREPHESDPLDHGTPPDPDRPTDELWRGNTLSEPPPGS